MRRLRLYSYSLEYMATNSPLSSAIWAMVASIMWPSASLRTRVSRLPQDSQYSIHTSPLLRMSMDVSIWRTPQNEHSLDMGNNLQRRCVPLVSAPRTVQLHHAKVGHCSQG